MFSYTAVASVLRLLSYGNKSVELFSMGSKQSFLYSSALHDIKLYTAYWRKLLLKSTESSNGIYSMEIQYYNISYLSYYGK